jgi:nucleoside-diphosphate-sugar epimerase
MNVDSATDWNGRPCLVTGGAGFGGAHLCERLLELRAKVYVLDWRVPPNSYLTLGGLVNRLTLVQADIRDAPTLALTLARTDIDTVFHLAAQPIVPLSNILPFETLSINVLGTYAMLEAVRTVKSVQRFVFASSGAYYGTTTTSRPLTEEDPPLVATNVYAPSKAAADLAVRCYAKIYGIKAAVCRFMNTYGPGDTNFTRIVPRAIQNLIRDAPYAFGDRDDGSTELDYIYVGDMADAYVRVAEQIETASGEAFNFGSGRPISCIQLTKLISRLFDGREREPEFSGPPKERNIIKSLDIHKAKERLNWQPLTPLEEGLAKTIAWYRRNWDRL